MHLSIEDAPYTPIMKASTSKNDESFLDIIFLYQQTDRLKKFTVFSLKNLSQKIDKPVLLEKDFNKGKY